MLGVQGGHHLTREAAVQTVLGRPLQAREWSGGPRCQSILPDSPPSIVCEGPFNPPYPSPADRWFWPNRAQPVRPDHSANA